MLTGISGSKTWRSCAQMASGSGAPSASVAALTVLSATCLADGVAVLAVDAEEAEVGLHGVAAAERLVDHDLRAGGTAVLVAGGNLRGGDFAGEGAVALSGMAE